MSQHDKADEVPLLFAFFNEIGILEQLARTRFEAELPDGVIVPHFSVLNHLIRVEDGRTPLDIARAFQVPKTTMSHTLSVLEKRGWIDMRANPRDRRSKCVWITNAGREFRNSAIASLGPSMAEFSEIINIEDIKAILPTLTKVREIMDEARNT